MTSLAALELTLGVDGMVELRALARTLERAEGFTLVFAQCNDFGLRDRIIEQLRAMLAGREPLVIAAPPGVIDLRPALLDSLPPDRPHSLFVTGLERSLDSRADFHPVLANLNAARNDLPEGFGFAVVFWLPEFALRLVAQQAPDFWSWRSAAYAFPAPHEERPEVVTRLLGLGPDAVVNLPLDEKRDRLSAVQRLLSEYTAEDGTDAEKRARARLLRWAGLLKVLLGDILSGGRDFAQALNIARQLDDPRLVAASSRVLGLLQQAEGEHEEARQRYEEALATWRRVGDHPAMADLLYELGTLYQEGGEYEQARQHYEESLEIARELASQRRVAASLRQLGALCTAEGKYAEARQRYEEALAIAREARDGPEISASLYHLGKLHRDQHDLEQATRCYEESLAVARQLGGRFEMVSALYQLGTVHRDQGDLDRARERYEEALAISRQLGDRPGTARVLHQLGLLAEDTGEYPQAAGLLAQALAILTELGSPQRETAIGALSHLRVRMGTEAFGDALREAGFEAEEQAVADSD